MIVRSTSYMIFEIFIMSVCGVFTGLVFFLAPAGSPQTISSASCSERHQARATQIAMLETPSCGPKSWRHHVPPEPWFDWVPRTPPGEPPRDQIRIKNINDERTYSKAVIDQAKVMLATYKDKKNARFEVTDTTVTKLPSSSSSSSSSNKTPRDKITPLPLPLPPPLPLPLPLPLSLPLPRRDWKITDLSDGQQQVQCKGEAKGHGKRKGEANGNGKRQRVVLDRISEYDPRP